MAEVQVYFWSLIVMGNVQETLDDLRDTIAIVDFYTPDVNHSFFIPSTSPIQSLLMPLSSRRDRTFNATFWSINILG